jgi:predicted nucleotidyltransferase
VAVLFPSKFCGSLLDILLFVRSLSQMPVNGYAEGVAVATVNDLEERVRRLEENLAVLTQQVAAKEDALAWIDRISGSMKDLPEFEQVVQFGADFRQSQRDAYPIASDAD